MKKLPQILIFLGVCFFISSGLSSEVHPNVSSPSRRRPAYVSGELLVKFKPSVRRKAAEFYRTQLGVITKRTLKQINVQLVQLPEDMSVEEALEIYRNDPSVEYAEPNYYRYLMRTTPNDPDFGLLWGLDNTGQDVNSTSGTLGADVDAPEAWDTTTGSSSVIIAVIDSGADYNHPDLSDNIWINSDEVLGDANGDGFPGLQEVDDDGDGLVDEDSHGREPGDNGYTNDLKNDDDENGYEDDLCGWDFENDDNDPSDPDGHGTHVAGIIAAEGNNGTGVTGVSWNSKIMLLKFTDAFGAGTSANEIRAIEYATAKGASIINLSVGGFGFNPIEKAAIDASSAVVVCSAGNDGLDNDDTPVYPASYNSDNIISVAATDQDDDFPGFSNYGSASVDVAAPGVNILSTWPGTDYQYGSGTSMAAAYVSGVAALVKSKNSSWSNLNVKTAITSSVDVKPSLSDKVLTKGRVNAARALQATISTSSNTGGGGGGGGGGCFIATAAYGSPLEPHVKILVEFRNRYLLAHLMGRYFVKLYYSCSPSVAQFILQHDTPKFLVRCFLLPIVIVINAAIFYGMPVSITGFGLAFAMICYLFILNRRRRIRNDPFSQT